jgi:hypothetical protein
MINFFNLMGMLDPLGDLLVVLLFVGVGIGLILWWRHLDKMRKSQ